MRQPLFTRRLFLASSALGLAACTAASAKDLPKSPVSTSYDDDDWRNLSDADWKARLSPAAYAVLREHDTERAFTSPLDRETRTGVYHCAGCDLALFSSDTKFDSGTGWPSFWEPLPGVMGTSVDRLLFYPRTEYHCARCLGHQGHVFDDGPAPTGQRWCNNGVALAFKAA
ncbi:peptide-methionine (R)-S-oxide reductase MsrB [Hyphomonas sp.]|jgi:peptide-methionine (R)-S-oxide reductase|uniref:peptide-methionine (R)-S-oxide reductase MsrB n=1 Tax=Hyphomonas sp. TaxID=87 RepID=UPI001BD0D2F6|nr:peptide-methionine (R)-S-oxide reductase MsrB [Hyphomonas sp.]